MIRVLLPTDFSNNALHAIRYALLLFKEIECTFYLLNTYMPASYAVGSMPNTFSALQMEEIMKENSKRRLDGIEKKIKKEDGNDKHRFKKISAFNFLTNEISKIVKKKKIDYVIMGTQGATGAKEIFLGTQTMYAIKKAKCPLIAVPELARLERPKNILFPTAFEIDLQKNCLNYLKKLCDAHSSQLIFLHVNHGDSLNLSQKEVKEWLHKYFQAFNPQFHFDMNIKLIDAVNLYQEKFKINMLAMVHDQHGFFSNLLFKHAINQFAYHTKVPFLVLPSKIHLSP
jgi:nucleotide-binding universal stress UspA family protein